MDDLRYWLALYHAPGIGARTFQRLLEFIKQPEELFRKPLTPALLELIPARARPYFNQPDWERVDASLKWAKEENHHILHLGASHYPRELKEISDPPPILFIIGNPALLSQPQLAIIGSRNPTPGGKQNAFDFAQSLAQAGLTITSGLALGIDTASHQGALSMGGQTVAITGTGLDRVYPARNRELAHQIAEQGALVSEYPLGTGPHPGNFPRRNRIISGLSLGTLVVEAGLASGSLITARLANEQGREVFAIPGSIHNPLSRGCHHLLRDGAKLVESTQDILEELSHLITNAPTPSEPPAHENEHFDKNTNLLLKNLGHDPISIDTLIEQSGLTVEEISSMLTTLELNNLVASSAGNYYLLPEKAPR